MCWTDVQIGTVSLLEEKLLPEHYLPAVFLFVFSINCFYVSFLMYGCQFMWWLLFNFRFVDLFIQYKNIVCYFYVSRERVLTTSLRLTFEHHLINEPEKKGVKNHPSRVGEELLLGLLFALLSECVCARSLCGSWVYLLGNKWVASVSRISFFHKWKHCCGSRHHSTSSLSLTRHPSLHSSRIPSSCTQKMAHSWNREFCNQRLKGFNLNSHLPCCAVSSEFHVVF